LLQPEEDRKDCRVCEKWRHYPYRQPADQAHLAGQMVYVRGKPVLRTRREVPDCDNCPGSAFRWTDANRALYRRWRLSCMLGLPPRTARDKWAFFRLGETDREAQNVLARRNNSELMASVLGGLRRGIRS